jgi:hypothetical protein
VIYTGPNEPNLRVVRVLDDDERGEDPEWFQMLVVDEAYQSPAWASDFDRVRT